MPYDPLNPPLPFIDENLRSIPLGQPGTQDFDNPIHQYVSRGEDSKQSQNKINEQIINDLMNSYDYKNKTVLGKFYYYPESIGNISTRSFVDDHETPRHIVKFTILDYAGGNLISEEAKKFIDNINIGDFSTWIPNKNIISDPKTLFSPEINNYQNSADKLSYNKDVSEIMNEAIKEGKGSLESREENKLREEVSKYLNGNFNKDIISRYLTSKNNPMLRSALINEISSKTVINSNILPDEIKSIIYLYANGTNLNYNYSTNWSATEQESWVTNLQNTVANLAETGDISQAVTDVGKTLIARILKDVAAPTDIGRSIISKLGVAPAQNYEYLFEGVGRRSFDFSTVFYPKNKKEIENVAKIISAFKYYSHPSRQNKTSALVKVPCVFLIENLTYVEGKGWVENLYLPKHKLCALLSTSVNYSQNGNLVTHEQIFTNEQTFKSPVKITMMLSFQEIHVLTREDIPDPRKFFDGQKQQSGYY